MQDGVNRKITIVLESTFELEEDGLEEDTSSWSNKDLYEYGQAYVENMGGIEGLVEKANFDLYIRVLEE